MPSYVKDAESCCWEEKMTHHTHRSLFPFQLAPKMAVYWCPAQKSKSWCHPNVAAQHIARASKGSDNHPHPHRARYTRSRTFFQNGFFGKIQLYCAVHRHTIPFPSVPFLPPFRASRTIDFRNLQVATQNEQTHATYYDRRLRRTQDQQEEGREGIRSVFGCFFFGMCSFERCGRK